MNETEQAKVTARDARRAQVIAALDGLREEMASDERREQYKPYADAMFHAARQYILGEGTWQDFEDAHARLRRQRAAVAG